MRKNNLLLIAAILAVVALVIGIPTFVSGCGGEDGNADSDRVAQQIQDRDRDCEEGSDCPGMQGRGMGRVGMMGQDSDCDGYCLESECDGDCEAANAGDCDCDSESLDSTDDGPFGSEPICF